MNRDSTAYESLYSDDSLSDDSTDSSWAKKRKKISDRCLEERNGNVSMNQDSTADEYFDSDDSLSDYSPDNNSAENGKKKPQSSSTSMWAEEKNGNVCMNQDSGYTSFHPDDSHSADSSKTGKLQEYTDSSLTSICAEESRHLKYQINFPDYNMVLDCQSSGKETIFNMVVNRFDKPSMTKYKPKFENMIFMDSNSDCLNIGLPAGVLSTQETYKCKFKKDLRFRPSNHLRQYAVDKYDSNWEMGHFFVSKDEIPSRVSPFQKIIQDKMQVDFFKDETVFEALVRDNRFNEKTLRWCRVTCDGKKLELSFKAENYQGKSINISRMNQEDTSLPTSIPPRPCPYADKVNSKVETSEIKQEMNAATAGPSIGPPLASSTPAVETRKRREDFAYLFRCALDIKPNEIIIKDKTKLKKLAKECDLKCKNFAAEQGYNAYICQLEEVTEIAKSVGAVFVLNQANVPQMVGTCFRIGTRYVITNNHVCNMITTKDNVFINFNFKKGESLLDRRNVDCLMVKSEELDYAILRMEEPSNELPPCIFSHGISIMDPNQFQWSSLEGQCLTLIGHPHGQPKQTDLLCPVVTKPLDSLEVYGHALRWARSDDVAEKECRDSKDPRRGTYQVTMFFHGSSGSPGIVFQNEKKRLVVLHTKGFFLQGGNKSFIEQGVFLTEIYKDVQKLIGSAQQDLFNQNVLLKDITIADIFPSVETV